MTVNELVAPTSVVELAGQLEIDLFVAAGRFAVAEASAERGVFVHAVAAESDTADCLIVA